MNDRLRFDPDLLRYASGDRSGPLSRLLFDQAISSVFQPIVSMVDGRIHAHEALVRGPAGMPLHAPDALLAAARREGLLMDFQVACVCTALRQWATQGQPGRLFVNIGAPVLVSCFKDHRAEIIAEQIRALGVQPQKVVFEITEQDHVVDIPALVAVAETIHSAGMTLALDDFGDGHSSLRLWSELRPDLVKIDKYFTQDAPRHAQKVKTLQAVIQLAETFGTSLIAEGVETADELRLLRDLGIAFGQGYYLGRPQRKPASSLAPPAAAALRDRRISVMPSLRVAASPGRLRHVPMLVATPVSPSTSNDEVAAIFKANPSWHSVALVVDGRPMGLIGRQQFLGRYAHQYFKEIHGRKACLDYANPSPTMIEVQSDVDELIGVLTSPDQRYLSEGFIYTRDGLYLGLGTGHQLVRQVTESRIEAARHANPLTLLPGNIPISEHVKRLHEAGASFVACYGDLSDFKPFNDHYGYWRGDEVIKLVAATLREHCDPQRDFVGHIGGDDFVVLFQSADWAERCSRIAEQFDCAVRQLYDDDARAKGGIVAEDRHGVSRFFGFISLYMGVVPVGQGAPRLDASALARLAARARLHAKSRGEAWHAASQFHAGDAAPTPTPTEFNAL